LRWERRGNSLISEADKQDSVLQNCAAKQLTKIFIWVTIEPLVDIVLERRVAKKCQPFGHDNIKRDVLE
jgi:hypothetical protein